MKQNRAMNAEPVRIVLRVNAENGRVVFAAHIVERKNPDLRLYNTAQQFINALIAGTDGAYREERQMPVCPFKITVDLLGLKHDLLTARTNYALNGHCTASMLEVGRKVYAQVEALLDSYKEKTDGTRTDD